jgi:2-iminobutanoate/2-iminopropanoate deaminase
LPKKTITTDRGPKPIANFSQAVVANGFVFLAGVAARDPATQQIVGSTVEEQAERMFENVKAMLEAAGSSLEQVVRVIVYLRDPEEFPRFNTVWERYFPFADPPARAVLFVPVFGFPEMLVEVVVTALAE